MFIDNETPTGTIDGINKVFLLANSVSYIDEVWLDGASYNSYSLVGNQLIMADAPMYTLTVDYYTGTSNPEITSTVTLADMESEVWRLLGAKSSSTNFSETIVRKKLNAVSRKVWRGRVISMISGGIVRGKVIPPTEYRAGKMWFTEGKYNFRIQAGSQLTANANPGDTTVSCDTTYLNASGYVEIGGEVIKDTSKSTTQLLGVTGITMQHLEQEGVVQLYTMPTNIDKLISVSKISSGKYVTSSEIPLDNTSTYGTYYQILRANGVQLLKVVGLQNDDMVLVTYSIKLFDLVNQTDTCQFPDDYGITVIAAIAAGELGYEKNLPDGGAILKEAYNSLQEMFQFFTNETTVIKQSIKPNSYKFSSVTFPRGWRM